jgi:hypothetical protein
LLGDGLEELSKRQVNVLLMSMEMMTTKTKMPIKKRLSLNRPLGKQLNHHHLTRSSLNHNRHLILERKVLHPTIPRLRPGRHNSIHTLALVAFLIAQYQEQD